MPKISPVKAKKSEITVKKKTKKPSDKLADKSALTKFLQGVFGDPQKKTLRRMQKKVAEINRLEKKYEAMDDKKLSLQTAKFKEQLEKGKKLDDILPRALRCIARRRKERSRCGHSTCSSLAELHCTKEMWLR